MKGLTAKLNSYRQSPRKVRLVVDAVRGKMLSEALTNLLFIPKRASGPILKLLKSAAANAKKESGFDVSDLKIKSIAVDKGFIMYRQMPRARGSASPIRKRTSKVSVTLEPINKKK